MVSPRELFFFILLLSSNAVASLPRPHAFSCTEKLSPPTVTERTEIRRLVPTDYQRAAEILRDPRVSPSMLLDTSNEAIRKMTTYPEHELHFAIVSKSDSKVIGIFSFWDPTEEVMVFSDVKSPRLYDGIELGIALDPSASGQGIATEVLKRMIQLASDRHFGKKIYAMVLKDNVSSQNMLKKAGFAKLEVDSGDNLFWFENNLSGIQSR